MRQAVFGTERRELFVPLMRFYKEERVGPPKEER